MTLEQILIFSILFLVLVFFVWGRWRYDLVALLALLVAAFVGLVPPVQAFDGFGHPAVITVAAVLVVSRGLLNSGMVDFIVRLMSRVGENAIVQLSALVAAVTLCSGFMNNIGGPGLVYAGGYPHGPEKPTHALTISHAPGLWFPAGRADHPGGDAFPPPDPESG